MPQARMTESDIRLAIDRFLRDNQIAVAFPQRDIHLDTIRPLEVRVVPAAAESATSLYRDAA